MSKVKRKEEKKELVNRKEVKKDLKEFYKML